MRHYSVNYKRVDGHLSCSDISGTDGETGMGCGVLSSAVELTTVVDIGDGTIWDLKGVVLAGTGCGSSSTLGLTAVAGMGGKSTRETNI